jgi:hypothetical protein
MFLQTMYMLLCLGLVIYVFRPKRLRKPQRLPISRVSSRALFTDRPPPKKAQPFLPLLFGLLSQTAGDIKEAWQTAKKTWHNHPVNMSSSLVIGEEKPKSFDASVADLAEELEIGKLPVAETETEKTAEIVPPAAIVQMVLARQDGRKLTETLKTLPGYSGRKHKAYSDAWKAVEAALEEEEESANDDE